MAGKAKRIEAVAYIRTSSAANVGADKNSDKRQRAAIEGFAKRLALVGEFTDAAVSGADPIEIRRGFAEAMLINKMIITIAGGTFGFGASAKTGPDSPGVDEKELAAARDLGKRVLRKLPASTNAA